MKLYNCPGCVMISCDGCPRTKYQRLVYVPYVPCYPVNEPVIYQSPQSVSPCNNCPNNILNGGSGICNCTLGGTKITCGGSSNPSINGDGEYNKGGPL